MELPYTYEQWVKIGKFAQLDDGKVFYVHKGQGFPVVINHQYGGNSWWFSRVVDALAKRFSVYVLDIPGCAQSETPPLPYGPPEYSLGLKEFMDRVGIERAHLIGRHGSALTSVHFSSTWPSRVSRLVLDGVMPWTIQEGKKYWRDWMKPQWTDGNDHPLPYLEGAGRNSFPNTDKELQTIGRNRYVEDHGKHGDWWITTLKMALKYEVFDSLHLIEAPTLLLYGEDEWIRQGDRDVVASYKAGLGVAPPGGSTRAPGPEVKMLNGIRGSRLELLPETGSMPAFERPDVWSKAVLAFLTEAG